MGEIYDRAEAKAELRLRKQLARYVIDRESIVANYRGRIGPRWIALAAEYTDALVKAYAHENLDATAPNPRELLARVETHAKEVTDRVFETHFSSHIHIWNMLCEENSVQKLDKAHFSAFVTGYSRRSGSKTTAQWLERAITKFWQERSRMVMGENDRKQLKVVYLRLFPNNSTNIRDICWAARQHYSEWKRWLQVPSVIKDGSVPDLAFRAILTSGKHPHEYRKELRPPKWS